MWKKKLILALPYVFVGLAGTKLWQGWRMSPGGNVSERFLRLGIGFERAFATAVPSFYPEDILAGVLIGFLFWLAVYIKGKQRRKFRQGVEYGSARWGGRKDIEPYMAPAFADNIILTQTEGLTMESRPKDPKTARNKNVLVIGGSGSGKTRYFLKPNLMQCTSDTYPVSFVVTDPNG